MSAASTQAVVFFFIFAAIIILVLTPFTLYYCYKMWILRKEPFFSKRYVTLTIIILLSFVYVAFARIISGLPIIIPSITYNKSSQYLIPIGTQVPFVLMFVRLWHLYFDYTRGLQLISNEWKSKISTDQNTYHWTLKYNKWLSSSTNRLYYMCIIFIILTEVFFTVIGSCVNLSTATICFCTFVGVECIIGMFIVYKVRPCRDELFIQWEFRRIGVVGLVAAILLFVVLIFFEKSKQGIGSLIHAYICTKSIIDKYENRISTKNNGNPKNHISLQEGLKNKDIFDLFALCLVREFSIENLLFLFEAMQFKNNCLKNGIIEDSNIGIVLEFGAKSNLENKIINDMDTFMDNLLHIIDRYIDISAEYCVNISSSTRNKILITILPFKNIKVNTDEKLQSQIVNSKICNDKNSSDMKESTCLMFIKMIDQAMIEIVQLLSSDSFVRFTQTDQFKQVYDN